MNKSRRRQHKKIHKQKLVDDYFFLDESGVLLETIRRYARASSGQRAWGSQQGKRVKRVTVIATLSKNGLSNYGIFDGGITKEAFSGYLNDILLKSLRPGQTVVMDNLSSHKNGCVKSLLKSAGCRVLYLPPYSPDLNPIEMAWSKLKKSMEGTKCRNFDAFGAYLMKHAAKITRENAVNWIRHCGYRLESND